MTPTSSGFLQGKLRRPRFDVVTVDGDVEASMSDVEMTRESGEGVDELLDDLEYDPVGGTNRVDRADDLSDEVGGEFVRARAGRRGRPIDAVQRSADKQRLKWHR